VLALLTIGLCWYTVRAWRQTRSARGQVAQVQSEIEKLDRQREAGIALLNQPQNRDVANQAAFLNALIARRSFSWTQLFMELEQIMPSRLHVTSIAPTLNKSNQIEIHMLVGGDARDQALELVRRLEDSHSFRQPALRAETFGQNSPSGDRVQFDISLVYVPQAAPEQARQDKTPREQALDDEKSGKQAPAKKSLAVRPLDPANASAAVGAGRKGVAR
jgi:hypothetical protein